MPRDTGMSPWLQFKFLGPPQMLLNGQQSIDLGLTRARGLFYYLVLESGQAHRRERLMTLFWPAASQRKAQQNLRTVLYRIRQSLRSGKDVSHLLRSSRTTVRFEVSSASWLDVAVFEHLCSEGELEQAIDLYQGELLQGFSLPDSELFERWLQQRRDSLHRLAMDALQRLTQRHMENGQYERASSFVLRQLELEPWREEAHRHMMQIFHRRGERSAALAQFERCRQLLKTELDVEPSAETVALNTQIAAGDTGSMGTYNGLTSPIPPSAPHNGWSTPRRNWGDAPEIVSFYGRTREVALLQRWLLDDKCRLVALLGMGGVGKTALAAMVAQQVAGAGRAVGATYYAGEPRHAHTVPPFDYVAWRSLINAPALEDLMPELLHTFSGGQIQDTPQMPDQQLRLLFSCMERHRCLLVLDNVETILHEDGSGRARAGYQAYAQLIRRMGESMHRSCLLLTSRERPRGIGRLDHERASVHVLSLAGLTVEAGQELLEVRGVKGTSSDVATLVHAYAGNPLALKLVAQTIQELFDGEIQAFLAEDSWVFDDVRDVLQTQFDRLSDLEREILIWLAVAREAVSPDQLMRNLVRQAPPRAYLEALRALRRRSLLEVDATSGRHAPKEGGTTRFSLQNVVNEYVTGRLVEEACREFLSGPLDVLRRHALVTAQSPEYVRRSQSRLILQPVAERLLAHLGKAGLEKRMQEILARLREVPLAPGYAAGNVLNLLVHIMDPARSTGRPMSADAPWARHAPVDVDLRGYDFSGLSVWQADLRNVDLRSVNFSGADLDHSVFSETFGFIYAVAISPDETLVAAGAAGGEIYLWETESRRPVAVLPAHTGPVRALTFSPDGRYLASGGVDGAVCLWHTDTWVLSQRLEAREQETEPQEVYAIVFDRRGDVLASGSAAGSIRMWRVPEGQLIRAWRDSDSDVRTLAFSPDGRTVASGHASGKVHLWDAHTGEIAQTLTDHSLAVSSVTFDPKGRWLASSGADRTVRIWDLAGGCLLHALDGHQDWIWSAAFSADGTTLVTGSADHTVRIWDVRRGQLDQTLSMHTGAVTSVRLGQHSRILVSGSADQTVCLWDLGQRRPIQVLSGQIDAVTSLACSPDGQLLASGGTNRLIYLWNLETGERIHTQQEHTNWVGDVAFSPDGCLLASGDADGTVLLWDVARQRPLQILTDQAHEVWSVSISPDGQLLAAGSQDHIIRLWNPATGKEVGQLRGHMHWVEDIAFSPNGRLLASGGADKTVRVWDLESRACLCVLEDVENIVRSVAISPDGRLLAAGGDGGSLRLWSMPDGRLRSTLQCSLQRIWSVAFSPDGAVLAGAGDDGVVYLWNLHEGEHLVKWERGGQWILSLAFTPDGKQLVSGGVGGAIDVWDVDTGKLSQTFHLERPYAEMDITGATGLSDAQRAALRKLGAAERT